MDVYVKVVRQGSHVLVAACDAELLGRTLRFGKVDFEVREEFYGGSLTDVEEAVKLIRGGTVVNLVGSHIVKRAVEEGLVHPRAVISLSGVPHTQIVKL